MKIYNLGNSDPITLNQLVALIREVTQRDCPIVHSEVPAGDVPVTYANISKAERELGYTPATGFQEGLAAMWDWMLGCPKK